LSHEISIGLVRSQWPWDEAELLAEREAVGGGRDGEAAVLVGGALVGRGGFVADERRAGIEGQRLEVGVDDGAVLGRAAHHRLFLAFFAASAIAGAGRGLPRETMALEALELDAAPGAPPAKPAPTGANVLDAVFTEESDRRAANVRSCPAEAFGYMVMLRRLASRENR
jgi:hypothetical protein